MSSLEIRYCQSLSFSSSLRWDGLEFVVVSVVVTAQSVGPGNHNGNMAAPGIAVDTGSFCVRLRYQVSLINVYIAFNLLEIFTLLYVTFVDLRDLASSVISPMAGALYSRTSELHYNDRNFFQQQVLLYLIQTFGK